MIQLIKSILKRFGISVLRTENHKKITEEIEHLRKRPQFNMYEGLQRANYRGMIPTTIIDVGAAAGNWSIASNSIWSKANYVLFEPLEERKSVLNKLAEDNSNFYIVNKGVGEKKEKVSFFVTEDLDGSGVSDNGTGAKEIEIEVTTLDEEISDLKLKGPYLIKLDTHGFEVPILEGAKEVLKDTSLLIIECYGYHIAPNSLLFHEMCQYMLGKGFRLIDVVDVMHRPKDKTFWQCDAFFAPTTDVNFQHNTYHY